jgi:predicted sugar kinase
MLHSRDPDPTDSNVSLSVESYGRIHFGLMEICDGQPHCFGGIGVMIDHSRAIVQAKLQNQSERLSRSFTPESCHIEADQYWLPRIEAIVNAWHTRFGSVPVESLALHSTPVPHCGLGSGTQLACTLVAALLAAHRHSDDAKHTCTFTYVEREGERVREGERYDTICRQTSMCMEVCTET